MTVRGQPRLTLIGLGRPVLVNVALVAIAVKGVSGGQLGPDCLIRLRDD